MLTDDCDMVLLNKEADTTFLNPSLHLYLKSYV